MDESKESTSGWIVAVIVVLVVVVAAAFILLVVVVVAVVVLLGGRSRYLRVVGRGEGILWELKEDVS